MAAKTEHIAQGSTHGALLSDVERQVKFFRNCRVNIVGVVVDCGRNDARFNDIDTVEVTDLTVLRLNLETTLRLMKIDHNVNDTTTVIGNDISSFFISLITARINRGPVNFVTHTVKTGSKIGRHSK